MCQQAMHELVRAVKSDLTRADPLPGSAYLEPKNVIRKTSARAKKTRSALPAQQNDGKDVRAADNASDTHDVPLGGDDTPAADDTSVAADLAAGDDRFGAARANPAADGTFPIVGVGASAGGLEALEQFFSSVPDRSGAAFVVIQHLDPTHKAMLPELLQHSTTMKVVQIVDGMQARPDRVYVIPPDKDLSIEHGTLHLLAPGAPRGLRLPINFFLCALAQDQGERSVGVILSGMGSDGTLGLIAIKDAGGRALVQDPASAKFDSMPRSAIDAHVADVVAAPAELATMIADTFGPNQCRLPQLPEPETPADKGALRKIVALLRAQTGQDFSLYKKNSVYRRIERRMGLHRCERLADYARYLGDNPQELEILFKEMLIGVTSFFRDPPAWAYLRDHALAARLGEAPDGTMMRAWVVGCSTGEEAYSLAICFREALEQRGRKGGVMLQIFATDLDRDAIDKARTGVYPGSIVSDVSPERLANFFAREGDTYRVTNEIREMVVFATQNVAMDPPFTKLDILSCRNLLIYLGSELQAKLLPLFHYSLKPGGILFLGSAETVGKFSNLFVPLDAKLRIYQGRSNTPPHDRLSFPTRRTPVLADLQTKPARSAASTVPNLQSLAEQLLLQHFVPPAVLVNSEGDIIFISGRTGRYLEPAAGKANWNIHVMAREGLRSHLLIGLPQALRHHETVTHHNVAVGVNGNQHNIDLTILPIKEPQTLQGMAMIVFADVASSHTPPASSTASELAATRAVEMEQNLKSLSEELQAVREEMQTREEELKSANEELQSTNEELQTTNEELTTSREEMQSLNEELQTVNAELQAKVDELSSASNDMKNLLNSTDIATIFLDRALYVRRFTTQATRIFKLISSDVGRPLLDIVTDLQYSDLQDDAQQVLQTLEFSKKEIKTLDGRWFSVKIMPYRTITNVIDGVVVTFSDISAAKQLEHELRKSPAEPN
jgi:two-component system, chemotaxis family, CheB/CheR fusion protein